MNHIKRIAPTDVPKTIAESNVPCVFLFASPLNGSAYINYIMMRRLAAEFGTTMAFFDVEMKRLRSYESLAIHELPAVLVTVAGNVVESIHGLISESTLKNVFERVQIQKRNKKDLNSPP